MGNDERDVLQVLNNELEFLDRGGYVRSKASGRPALIFEDSPTCPNLEHQEDPLSCSECALMQLVPLEARRGKSPCRSIPLNASGETLDSLYRYADPRETETALRDWLTATIREIEERRFSRTTELTQDVCRKADTPDPLLAPEKMEVAKCANPACGIAFRWIEGGKFFSLRPQSSCPSESAADDGSTKVAPKNKYYWLCERCSHVFALEASDEFRVTLRLLCPEIPLSEPRRNSKTSLEFSSAAPAISALRPKTPRAV